MSRIRHIALTTKDPGKVAASYKQAFGMRQLCRNEDLDEASQKVALTAARRPR
jgi:hypothetical protein